MTPETELMICVIAFALMVLAVFAFLATHNDWW